jgi:HlyD family secretion protein
MEVSKMKKIALAGLALAALAASCGDKTAAPGGSGFVEATEVIVSAETVGQVQSVRFSESQAVRAGDTLAVVDTTTTALRLREARAARRAAEDMVEVAGIAVRQATQARDLAKKEYDRLAALVEAGAVDRQRYDEAETGFNQASLGLERAQAELKSARSSLERADSEQAILATQLGDCFLRSPASGTVTEKYVEAGEFVSVAKPVARLATLDTVWVKIYLPPKDLTAIDLGAGARVDPEDGSHEPLDGKVTWISKEAEFTPKNIQTKAARADLVYAVKVTVPNRDGILKVGMPVFVEIP